MPFDGEVMRECEVDPIGVVRPAATVTFRGDEMIDDGRFGPPYPLSEGWHRWVGNREQGYPIDTGPNTLEFVATLADGSTITKSITVICDPGAVVKSGFVVSMDMYDQEEGYLMTFVLGDVDDQPDGWRIAATDTTVVLPVHPEATFIVHSPDWIYSAQLTVDEFSALVTFVDDGLCFGCSDGDCPEGPNGFQFPSGGGCIWSSGEQDGMASIAFEMLVGADGRVRQGKQHIYT